MRWARPRLCPREEPDTRGWETETCGFSASWHVPCPQAGVTVAIPIWQGRVSPLLDTASRMLVVSSWNGKETSRRTLSLGPQSADGLAVSIAEWKVNLLLCAGVSEPLRSALQRHGVRVWCHLCGEVGGVLEAFRRGQLHQPKFRMPGCWGPHVADHTCRAPNRPTAKSTVNLSRPRLARRTPAQRTIPRTAAKSDRRSKP